MKIPGSRRVFARSSFAFHVWHARRLELVAGRLHRGHWPSAVIRLAGPTVQCFILIVEMAACWCMGDDFVLLADDGEIKAVEQLLKSKYTVKVVSVIGDGSLQQEAVIPNRIVRYVPPNNANRMAMEIEPDQRHEDILLREHGLDDSRSKRVDTPRVKNPSRMCSQDWNRTLWIEKVCGYTVLEL